MEQAGVGLRSYGRPIFSSCTSRAQDGKSLKTLTGADAYISDYNICMDKLRNEAGEQLFPDGMKLITHWGLRDEIKSNYSIADKGLEKQRMIYEVMKHIVKQDIPAVVINNQRVTWQPISNKVFRSGKELSNPAREEDIRYNHLLTAMRQHQKLDQYYPQMPTQRHVPLKAIWNYYKPM